MAGDVCGASYLFVNEVTVVTSFKEVSGKLSSASMSISYEYFILALLNLPLTSLNEVTTVTVNYFYLFPVITQHATYKSRTNVKLSLYLKKAGLASRNIVHTKKILLRCVDFCFYFLHFICEADEITILIQRTPAGLSFRLLA